MHRSRGSRWMLAVRRGRSSPVACSTTPRSRHSMSNWGLHAPRSVRGSPPGRQCRVPSSWSCSKRAWPRRRGRFPCPPGRRAPGRPRCPATCTACRTGSPSRTTASGARQPTSMRLRRPPTVRSACWRISPGSNRPAGRRTEDPRWRSRPTRCSTNFTCVTSPWPTLPVRPTCAGRTWAWCTRVRLPARRRRSRTCDAWASPPCT